MSAPRHAVRPRPSIGAARVPHRIAMALAACIALLVVGCSRPEPPEKERPPEPQASAVERHTELRDAIQAPQDKARAMEGAVDDAAKAQRAAIEAAGG